MNHKNIKEEVVKNYLFNSSLKHKHISSFDLINCKLNLKLSETDFSLYEDFVVVLKNIKTREIYYCESEILNDSLIVDLNSLNFLCTDHEYMLLIVTKNKNDYEILYPILKNKFCDSISSSNDSTTIPVKWYTRFIENGEFRLSTIVKKYSIS
ncbi:hypothetical protein JCM1393_27400 [Clostridium carnis]